VDITVESIVFLIFSVITVGGGVLVVTTRNLFRAALFLMLSLFGVAGLFVLLAAPFLAGVQVVVYIGAIAILIIFAVMLTPQVTHTQGRNTQWTAGLVLAVILFLMLISVVTPIAEELGLDDWSAGFTQDDPADVPDGSLTELGRALVDPERYMLPFEVASLLLMAALIGAVMLVRPEDTRPRETQPDEAQPAAEHTREQLSSSTGD
jgi:NADH-quinone oxidoreductase subunit J